MEDDLWWKTTSDGRRPPMEENPLWKTTFNGRWPLMEDDLWWKYHILPESNVENSSPWQLQHNWPQTRNPISCLNRKEYFTWWKKCTRHYTSILVHKRGHLCAMMTKPQWNGGRVVMGKVTSFLSSGSMCRVSLCAIFEKQMGVTKWRDSPYV